ncbi:MAG TPA: ACP phosphodiesterase [Thermodesulfobacteriota bacterium]|nr:ACP phosphodiesterase [Thermodesulfobacteriota bacterium]
MNYLAHIYLAEDTEESLLGNIMGDFVKGPINGGFHPEIEKGIRTHRKVDAFTDTHEIYRASKKLISPERRRFSGIILDLAFDHLLARNWSFYSDGDLGAFIRSTYDVLTRRKDDLPEKFRTALPRMIEEDWLGSYRTMEGAGTAIDRISSRLKRRFGRENTLRGAIVEVERNYEELDRNFNAFFPELISFVESLRKEGEREPVLSSAGVR